MGGWVLVVGGVRWWHNTWMSTDRRRLSLGAAGTSSLLVTIASLTASRREPWILSHAFMPRFMKLDWKLPAQKVSAITVSCDSLCTARLFILGQEMSEERLFVALSSALLFGTSESFISPSVGCFDAPHPI